MQTNNTIIRKRLSVLLSGIFAILLTACGTHSNNGYGDVDGIYASDTETSVVEEDTNTESQSYYGQYFKAKAGAYSDLPEDGAIFTDIEAYNTTETLDADGNIIIEEVEYTEGYGAWGSNTDQVTVNIYNTGWNYGYWHRPYWWYGAGWGYTNYWYGPYIGIGYGWGYPYYGGFGYGYPYYSGFYNGYYNPYYNPYYYHGYVYNNIAYNRGRRNVGYSPGRTALRASRTNFNSGRDSYSRSEGIRRANSNTARRSNSVYRNNTNTVRRNTQTTRPQTNNSRTIRNNNSSRSRTNTIRSSNNTARPSSGSRSSGTIRSSGGSRSSGSSRSGGGRRGGGND